MADGKIEKAKAKAESNSGGVLFALLVLQLLIIPMQGWVGTTLWQMSGAIAETQKAASNWEARAVGDHERYEHRLEDHEQRLRRLEYRDTSMLSVLPEPPVYLAYVARPPAARPPWRQSRGTLGRRAPCGCAEARYFAIYRGAL